jgi:hypothetical protein
VTGIRDCPNDARVFQADPAESEKGGSGVISRESLEQRLHTPLEPARHDLPVFQRDHTVEGGDLEVLQDIYGEGMGGRFAGQI